jgi:hypothetical protein
MSEGVGVKGGIEDRHRRLLGGAIAAALTLVAVVLAIAGGSGGDGESRVVESGPHFVDAGGLEELEASAGHPVYWAGERPPARLELHEEAEGSIYLRYLPPGIAAGDPEQDFLTVGTYPVTDAVAALERSAASSGTRVESGPGEGVILRNPGSRGSVYLAYPGADIQIEVYDPTPGRSLALIRSGAIVPVGG